MEVRKGECRPFGNRAGFGSGGKEDTAEYGGNRADDRRRRRLSLEGGQLLASWLEALGAKVIVVGSKRGGKGCSGSRAGTGLGFPRRGFYGSSPRWGSALEGAGDRKAGARSEDSARQGGQEVRAAPRVIRRSGRKAVTSGGRASNDGCGGFPFCRRAAADGRGDARR
jgi:hypothetical protein